MAVKTLRNVATAVCKRWATFVSGEYTPPPCPSPRVLGSILEMVNFAAGHPEEGRYPRFNLTATAADQQIANVWRFTEPRPLNVAELRRLIPASDPKSSAVYIEWKPDDKVYIAGIHDMGASWYHARQGLSYRYQAPQTLFVEVERPNCLNVFQGGYRIASFHDGEAELNISLELSIFLHDLTRGGLNDISSRIDAPKDEPPREYENFEFLALWNCYAAMANAIASAGHGGTLLILPSREIPELRLLRRKYPMYSTMLTDAFVGFMNARHEVSNKHYCVTSEERSATVCWQNSTGNLNMHSIA